MQAHGLVTGVGLTVYRDAVYLFLLRGSFELICELFHTVLYSMPIAECSEFWGEDITSSAPRHVSILLVMYEYISVAVVS